MTAPFVPASRLPAGCDPDAVCVAVSSGRLLVGQEAGRVLLPRVSELDRAGLATLDARVLGTLDGVGCVALALADDGRVPDGMALLGLRAVMLSVEEEVARVAGLGFQIVEWQRTHRFCGACGTPTEDAPGQRAKRCPRCGLWAYPRVAPAVIVRVTRGDEILLAHGRRWKDPLYSVLAGFVDPGESLEETVHREIGEEAGIEVSGVRYFGSQPWPFPHSLMVAFTAEWAGGDLVVDDSELVHAAWFRRDALPQLPPPLSIARRLIDDFVAGRHSS